MISMFLSKSSSKVINSASADSSLVASNRRNALSANSLITQPRVLFIVSVLLLSYFVFFKYQAHQSELQRTLEIVNQPKVNDLYFIDFRLLGDKVKKNLRPTEKYRIAKVVDITGDVVTLLYGVFYYQRQHAAINSIRYGQLRYAQYFQSKRYDLPHRDIQAMHRSKALYLAKRPYQNKLYGNFVSPIKRKSTNNLFLLGKKENALGQAFLNDKYDELGAEKALAFFQQSAGLGYPQGQVNLAQMYINGVGVDKDLKQALQLLKTASLQSHKPAILKYGIICKQVSACSIFDFYRGLERAGVNIKVRQLDITPENILSQ